MSARTAPVNPNYTCTQTVTGALGGATATPGITNNCGGIPNRDLWYRFVTTSVVHRVQLQNVFPGSTAMTLAAFRGSCSAPVPLDFGCSTTGTLNLVGLTIGETILVRAYNPNGAPLSSTFNFRVSALTLRWRRPVELRYWKRYDDRRSAQCDQCIDIEHMAARGRDL
ncbi:MAG: hypothetical protein IPO87_16855 [Flavobacteriales bacterium]|nr:hypothetical protein [Flavobacteriales bacterium]